VTDAEDFLEFLAAAEEGGPTCADSVRIDHMLANFANGRVGVAELNAAARRLVAAECSLFLLDADTGREAWEPYLQWASGLGFKDTIVTVNYDLVPEKLGLLPFMPGDDHDNPHERFRVPRVLEMHGSVDWESYKDAEGRVRFKRHGDRHDYALTCADSALTIGTPGPRKAELSEQLQGILGTRPSRG
jgi:hypothetical protein